MPQMNRYADNNQTAAVARNPHRPHVPNPLPLLLAKRPVPPGTENPHEPPPPRRAVRGNSTSDFTVLRPWLAEYEKYAAAITPEDPRVTIARQMLGLLATAKSALGRARSPARNASARPTSHCDIIQQLVLLREQAECVLHARRPRDLPRAQFFPAC